jgi:ABC-type multidrug transport system ATPase subunit
MHSVLRDVSLRLNLGDRIVVFGREGSGKSTLLRLLTGVLPPTSGRVMVNERSPLADPHLSAGYVSSEESEPRHDTVNEVLHAFGATHQLNNLPARIGAVSEALGLTALLYRPAATLSTAERLRVNLARAALAPTPLVLLDDVADQLGVPFIQQMVQTILADRTVIVASRVPAVVDELGWPVALLHQGTLREPIALANLAKQVACPCTVDVWVEGVRYDLLRQLKQQAGVLDVRLLPCTDFSGQRLQVQLRSNRYLPAVYDTISRAPLVRVEETPLSLSDLLRHLN